MDQIYTMLQILRPRLHQYFRGTAEGENCPGLSCLSEELGENMMVLINCLSYFPVHAFFMSWRFIIGMSTVKPNYYATSLLSHIRKHPGLFVASVC